MALIPSVILESYTVTREQSDREQRAALLKKNLGVGESSECPVNIYQYVQSQEQTWDQPRVNVGVGVGTEGAGVLPCNTNQEQKYS